MTSSKALKLQAEAVRLVIWDLDETFWTGTLAETGQAEIIPYHCKIVEDLVGRGIMNSICSKNDLAAVRNVLESAGLWDKFIFPSVDWSAKGPRIKALIEQIKLRPASVLFIDDNPGNLAEVAALIPGIQVANEKIIPELLLDSRLQGAPDLNFERLSHYKILEHRQRDLQVVSGDNIEFLKQSGISITFEYDIEGNIDRAIELINRTNQLNYTKRRLSEDTETARKELREAVSGYDVRAALIRLRDRYGDYGYCGIYIIAAFELTHFAFSCRILGMGVERWVYRYLGQPRISVKEPVANRLWQPEMVDWIKLDSDSPAIRGATSAKIAIPELRLRGGCHLEPIAHYFQPYTSKMVRETNDTIGHLFFRADCSANLLQYPRFRDDLNGELKELDLSATVFETGLFEPIETGGIIILSFWGDAYVENLRHRVKRYYMPNNFADGLWEARIWDAEHIEKMRQQGTLSSEVAVKLGALVPVRAGLFQSEPALSGLHACQNLEEILEKLPENAVVFVVMPSEYDLTTDGLKVHSEIRKYNYEVRKLSEQYRHVHFLYTDDYVNSASQRQLRFLHFNRQVYYNMFEDIMAKYRTLSLEDVR